MTLEAFSEDHLKTFYFNPLLEQMEGFVEHFIKVNKLIKQTIQLPLIVSQNKTFPSHCKRSTTSSGCMENGCLGYQLASIMTSWLLDSIK